MFHFKLRSALLSCASPVVFALFALCVSPAALAQASADLDEALEHIVAPGDTLEGLARLYLADPQQWPALQQANQVANPRHLQPGSRLVIPAALLPTSQAQVQFVQGVVQATLPGGGNASTPAAQQTLPEGTRLQVGAQGFISILLEDGSTIRVHADSDLRLKQLRKRGRPGSVQSVIELQRGLIEPVVPPSAEGTRRLHIRTPNATASVRGTRFTVHSTADGRTLTTVTEGQVAVQGRLPSATLLSPGQGLAIAADGQIGIPRPLLAAPNLTTLPGQVQGTDALRVQLPPLAGASAYEVQVARDNAFTQVLHTAFSGSNDITLPALEEGHYQLAVRALDDAGLPGQQAVRSLTVKAGSAPVPQVLSGAGLPVTTGDGQPLQRPRP